MSSVNLNIKTETLNKSCFCNSLTYNVITPPCWLKPAVDNRLLTTDNSLRVWRLSLKKLYSEYNFNKYYLTKFYKACRRALRLAIYSLQCTIVNFLRLPAHSS